MAAAMKRKTRPAEAGRVNPRHTAREGGQRGAALGGVVQTPAPYRLQRGAEHGSACDAGTDGHAQEEQHAGATTEGDDAAQHVHGEVQGAAHAAGLVDLRTRTGFGLDQ